MSTTRIYEALAAMMNEIGPISKDRKNAGQGYNFRGIDDVYNELQPMLAKHKIFTTPEVLEERSEERTTRSGGVTIYRILKIKYTFWTTDGSNVSAIVIGEGMDSGDKASNKAMAVGHKYALMQVFSIPTAEAKDPENDNHDIAPREATPNPTPNRPNVPNAAPARQVKPVSNPNDAYPIDHVMTFPKFKGMNVNQTPKGEIDGYLKWLMDASKKPGGRPPSQEALILMEKIDDYHTKQFKTGGARQDGPPEGMFEDIPF